MPLRRAGASAFCSKPPSFSVDNQRSCIALFFSSSSSLFISSVNIFSKAEKSARAVRARSHVAAHIRVRTPSMRLEHAGTSRTMANEKRIAPGTRTRSGLANLSVAGTPAAARRCPTVRPLGRIPSELPAAAPAAGRGGVRVPCTPAARSNTALAHHADACLDAPAPSAGGKCCAAAAVRSQSNFTPDHARFGSYHKILHAGAG